MYPAVAKLRFQLFYRFRNWNEKKLRDNRVGANKEAKIAANNWINEVFSSNLAKCQVKTGMFQKNAII